MDAFEKLEELERLEALAEAGQLEEEEQKHLGQVMGGFAVPNRKEGFKSGFVTLVGRPNAGKSTLLNAIMGKKIAITSRTAQTTRHRFRAVLTKENGQWRIKSLTLIETLDE